MKQDPKPLNTGSVTQEVLTDSGPHHLSPYCSGTRRGPYASTRFALCSSPTPSLPSSIWRASSPRNRPPPPRLPWLVCAPLLQSLRPCLESAVPDYFPHCTGGSGGRAVSWSSVVTTAPEPCLASCCGPQTPGSLCSRQILKCVPGNQTRCRETGWTIWAKGNHLSYSKPPSYCLFVCSTNSICGFRARLRAQRQDGAECRAQLPGLCLIPVIWLISLCRTDVSTVGARLRQD